VKTIAITKIEKVENDRSLRLERSMEHAIMKKQVLLTLVIALGLLSVLLPVRQVARAQGITPRYFVAPAVFQAAGTTTSSIQSTVDAFRVALDPTNHNNGNNPPPPLDRSGHREINWDGGNTANVATVISGNPFDGFLATRGALFTTNGTGFVQAPPAGLADVNVFNNPTYGTIFKPFSLSRLFSPIGSNITEVDFFVHGGGNMPATVNSFGAVFTDVDQPDGSGPGKKQGNRGASTLMEYFGADGALLFSSFVPASPGDGRFSFFGIVFEDARIARVRITSGNVAPGPDDDGKNDIVMMDDFIYGEPQPL
jgi:hypothetical protein